MAAITATCAADSVHAEACSLTAKSNIGCDAEIGGPSDTTCQSKQRHSAALRRPKCGEASMTLQTLDRPRRRCVWASPAAGPIEKAMRYLSDGSPSVTRAPGV